jgi:hypothetical protein
MDDQTMNIGQFESWEGEGKRSRVRIDMSEEQENAFLL